MPRVNRVLPWDDLEGASAAPSVTSASCQPEVVAPIRSASFVGYLVASAACDELTTLGHCPRLRPAELPPRRDRSPARRPVREAPSCPVDRCPHGDRRALDRGAGAVA